MRRLSLISTVTWCLSLGTYLLFAGTISLTEFLAGLACATVLTGWARVIRRHSGRHFVAAREQIWPVLAALADLVPATGHTGIVLAKAAIAGGSPGCSRRFRFRFGADDDPSDRTRRAIAILIASLAPNRFVVDAERNRGFALMHAIDGSQGETDAEWLQ
jgi:multisubunit Na+/H+ antiporter MnhE subunit